MSIVHDVKDRTMVATYSSPDGEVAAKAHSRSSNETGAGWEGEKMVNSGVRVGIVGLEGLFTVRYCARIGP